MPDLDTIEAQVELDRAALSRSLDALAETVNPAQAADQIATMAEEYGGEIGRQAWSAARDNPAAFALVGAGVALLLSGTGKRARRPIATPTAVPPQRAMDGFDERVAAADAAMKKDMSGQSGAAPSASRLRAAMDAGLDKLPASARKKVIRARQAALDAQEQIERRAAKVARRSRSFLNEQPLAVGAVAFGVGALIGAVLPSTRREDALLGARRDALMDAAQQTLQEELEKAHATASETLRSVADQVSVSAKS